MHPINRTPSTAPHQPHPINRIRSTVHNSTLTIQCIPHVCNAVHTASTFFVLTYIIIAIWSSFLGDSKEQPCWVSTSQRRGSYFGSETSSGDRSLRFLARRDASLSNKLPMHAPYEYIGSILGNKIGVKLRGRVASRNRQVSWKEECLQRKNITSHCWTRTRWMSFGGLDRLPPLFDIYTTLYCFSWSFVCHVHAEIWKWISKNDTNVAVQ